MPTPHHRGALRRRIVGAVLGVAAGALLFAAAAPLFGGAPSLAAGARLALHGLCHQLPERSFGEGASVMALCHRCTGIYAGVGLGGLAALFGLRADPRSGRIWLLVAAVMALQVGAGWLLAAVDVWPLRVSTGLALGAWGGLALANAFDPSTGQSSASTSARSRETMSGVAP